MKNKQNELDDVLSNVGIYHFNRVEGLYVIEYILIMKYIVAVVGILQEEKLIGMGSVLSTLTVGSFGLLVHGLLANISRR